MVFTMLTRELSPDITAYSFTGSMVLGNRLSSVEHIVRERIKRGARKVLLDFSELDLIDSAGIRVLAGWFGSVQREGGKIAVAGATGRVKQLLEMVPVHHLIGTYPDLPSALRALSEG